MQYRTRYKGKLIDNHAVDLRSTKRDMNLHCFTQASPLTAQRITSNLWCEFGVICIKSDGTFLITNKHTHIHTYNVRK